MKSQRDIWVISDTHLNHENILKFTGEDGKYFRGDLFKDVDHMNETIVERWNSVVKPGDKVYHLGDVFFGSKDDFKKLWPRFNGKKRLIVGNHDDIKFLAQGAFFEKICMWRIFKEHGIVLTHVPIKEDHFRKVVLNVHGHIHEKPSPKGPYYNVSCEAINYTPIHIEDLAQIARKYV